MPLEDLLQILAAQGKGGILSLSRDSYYAEVSFNLSALHSAAVYRLRDGLLLWEGEDAMYELLRWPDAEFSFMIHPAPPMPQNVFVTVNYIVMEHCLKCDTQREQDKLAESALICPRIPQDPPLGAQINLDLDQWQLLIQVNGYTTIAQIAQNTRRNVETVVGLLEHLEKLGLVELPRPAYNPAPMQLDRYGGRTLPQSSHGYDAPLIFTQQPKKALPAPSGGMLTIPQSQPKQKVQRGILAGIVARLRGM